MQFSVIIKKMRNKKVYAQMWQKVLRIIKSIKY